MNDLFGSYIFFRREITRVCNELVYDGKLLCGNEETETAVLKMSSVNFEEEWLVGCLDESMAKAVVFLNTDSVPMRHTEDAQGLIFNAGESEIVLRISAALMQVCI